eukprot:CAMPEP_0203786588 /NCGR_PEP_ID=MMETSP0100_2-20121128/1718_1 /ASSEMBLY_ACC=CAM_ASM_000210 /TAXON_ID=96639 /ORGANISM=" , Strain NY0313808BC1" /LENGTH=109 /DNA_ID=CAMNT_0050688923 /DNA_START=188 /DNA_END=513 /DNA_ORIENTATION=-
MNDRDARIMREEARKWSRLKRASRRLQRLNSSPSLNLEANPFCEGKQIEDMKLLRKMNKNRIIAQDAHRKGKGLAGPEYKNIGHKVLFETLRAVDMEELADQKNARNYP